MSRADGAVEAILLYSTPPNLAFDRLMSELKLAFAGENLDLTLRQGPAASVVDIVSPKLNVRIECAARTVDPDVFKEALAAPITQLHPADFRGPAYGHGGYVSIIVSPGAVNTDGARKLYAGRGSEGLRESPLSARAGLRMRIARFLTDKVCDQARPLAIYWENSTKLLTPSELRAMRLDEFPLSLFTNPDFFSSGAIMNGTRVVGLRIMGAETLLGKPLIFNEAPLPWGHLLRRAHEFITYCRETGELMDDGDSFGMSETDVIRVAHTRPTDRYPNGTIELTYEKIGRDIRKSLGLLRPHPLPHYFARFAEYVMANRGPATYALCAFTLIAEPLIGIALLMFNLLFGVRLRMTSLVSVVALMALLSGSGVSARMLGWKGVVAALDAPSPAARIEDADLGDS